MTCHVFRDETGAAIGIACTRERKRRCYSCSAPNASLSCDGCDHVLCTNCAVSPRPELDWCPNCAKPAWLHWFAMAKPAGDQAARRQGFRLWARANADEFMRLAKARTKTSVREVQT